MDYGGYATVAGLAFTPELYKCGIDYVGVTNVSLLSETLPKHWESQREVLEMQIGDLSGEAMIKRMLPLQHVDKNKVSIMIVQGAKGSRVVNQHVTDLHDALAKKGVILSDDEWIMKENEGHGFQKQENKVELYTKMEKFLARYLK